MLTHLVRPSLQTCYIQENSFFQLVNLPTRGSNIPDLILTTNENLVENIEITDDEAVSLSSDHKAIVFDIILRRKPKKLPKRTVYNYNKGDFAVLRESLKLLLLTDIVLSEDDIDIAWMTWSNTFLAVVNTFITRKQACRSYIPPYFTSGGGRAGGGARGGANATSKLFSAPPPPFPPSS